MEKDFDSGAWASKKSDDTTATDEEKHIGGSIEQLAERDAQVIRAQLVTTKNVILRVILQVRLFLVNNQLAASLGLALVQLVCVILVLVFYNKLYDVSEYGACSLVSALVCGLSQGILQSFVHRQLLPWHTVKFHVWGVINGVLVKLWTDALNDRFSNSLVKVVCDQTIGNTVMVFLFISFSAYWDGLDVDNYLNRHFIPTLRRSVIIWPVASTVSFCIIPGRLMVPFNALVSLIWTVILGLLTK